MTLAGIAAAMFGKDQMNDLRFAPLGTVCPDFGAPGGTTTGPDAEAHCAGPALASSPVAAASQPTYSKTANEESTRRATASLRSSRHGAEDSLPLLEGRLARLKHAQMRASEPLAEATASSKAAAAKPIHMRIGMAQKESADG
jgi:hypothetical protein